MLLSDKLKAQRDDLIKTRDMPPWPFNYKIFRPIAMFLQPPTNGMDGLISMLNIKIQAAEFVENYYSPQVTNEEK